MTERTLEEQAEEVLSRFANAPIGLAISIAISVIDISSRGWRT